MSDPVGKRSVHWPVIVGGSLLFGLLMVSRELVDGVLPRAAIAGLAGATLAVTTIFGGRPA